MSIAEHLLGNVNIMLFDALRENSNHNNKNKKQKKDSGSFDCIMGEFHVRTSRKQPTSLEEREWKRE